MAIVDVVQNIMGGLKTFVLGTPEEQAERAERKRKRKEELKKLDELKRQAYNEGIIKGEIEKAKLEGLKDSGLIETQEQMSEYRSLHRRKKRHRHNRQDDSPFVAVSQALPVYQPVEFNQPNMFTNMYKDKPPQLNKLLWRERL